MTKLHGRHEHKRSDGLHLEKHERKQRQRRVFALNEWIKTQVFDINIIGKLNNQEIQFTYFFVYLKGKQSPKYGKEKES